MRIWLQNFVSIEPRTSLEKSEEPVEELGESILAFDKEVEDLDAGLLPAVTESAGTGL